MLNHVEHERDVPGRRYRCPKCKREVTVCVSATVACSRCERAMKRLPQPEAS